MAAKNGKRLYLITYSQLDENIFPTRESFGNMLEREFNRGKGKAKVEYWACCREAHAEGGDHYHCALKLSAVKKWIKVRQNIEDIYNIRVNISENGDDSCYVRAYRYITKCDENVAHSDNHPNLANAKSPATKHCIDANNAKRRRADEVGEPSTSQERSSSARKKLRLTMPEVGMFIRDHNITSYEELLATADERFQAGLSDLSDFVYNHKEESLRGQIRKAWDMAKAREEVDAMKHHDRLDILITAKTEGTCVCEGMWLKCAKEVLSLNEIPQQEFSKAVFDNLRLGRGKFRNIILVGETNRAKTFLLKPLEKIYKNFLFENPATHKYGWGGCEKKSVFLLQDFRWSADLITWKDFLLLLEGEKVKLPAPRNFFRDDVVISSDVAIFATGIDEIKFRGPYNARDAREDAMMKSRWRVFKLTHEFKEKDQIKVEPCGFCFANLVLP